MKKRKISCLIAFVLLFTLFFGQLPHAKIHAEVVSETELSIGSQVDSTINSTDQVQWYKVVPSEESIADFTHFRIKLESEKELNVSVYSSLENAKDNNTFDRYMGYTYENSPAQIDFPIAWTGPYYVKVEYYGEEAIEAEAVEGGTPAEPVVTEASYTINYEGVTLPPTNQAAVEECPVELSTKERENGKSILKELRTIRDTLLSKTEKGQELSSLYYKAAPYISAKIVLSKSTREDVYKNLVQLKPLFEDVAKNGSDSSYEITDKDQAAINDLFTISRDAAPDTLKSKMDQMATEVKLSALSELPVSAILNRAKLSQPKATDIPENRYIVKLKDTKKLSTFKAKVDSYGVQSIDPLNGKTSVFENMYVMELDDSDKSKASVSYSKASVDKVSNLPEVEFIEPVQQYHALSTDSQYLYQWSLKNDGEKGIKDADIQYEPLKELVAAKSLRDTTIAVIDTGVDHTLADLSGSIEGIGKTFVDDTSDAMDDNGHGTHVSGIIAAAADNHYSMSGINSSAKILPVKVLDASGSGDTEDIAYGIKYAADNGAKVINLSLGGPYSRTIEYALQYAYSKGVTIVAASGNEGMDELSYPASSKYTISVGATNSLDLVSDYSNYGKGLDIVAPGTDIPSIVPDGNLTYMSGTSMAAPHVAAIAGILLSHNPKLKPAEVEKLLTDTAKNVAFEEEDNQLPPEVIIVNPGYPEDEEDEEDERYPIELPTVPGYDYVSGWGRLNAFGAVSAVELNTSVNPIYSYHPSVTGIAKTGSVVKVMSGETKLGEAIADGTGKFSVKIPGQKWDEVLHVVMINTNAKAETTIRAVVQKDITPPPAPKVTAVSDKDVVIKGSAEANSTVTAKAGTKIIGSGKANDKGEYQFKISKQKAGTIISVTAKDATGNVSKETKTTVLDKTAPPAPKVNTVTNATTLVKGKTESSATVTVKAGKKTIGTGKANSKGDYSVKIAKQKAYTFLTVTAKDRAGNTSTVTRVLVKKAK